jgi:hypothetical protein
MTTFYHSSHIPADCSCAFIELAGDIRDGLGGMPIRPDLDLDLWYLGVLDGLTGFRIVYCVTVDLGKGVTVGVEYAQTAIVGSN